MCGRYRFYDHSNPDIAKLIDKARETLPPMTFQELSLEEVFPGSLILVRLFQGKDGFSVCRWGFPFKGKLIINARSETWKDTPLFRGTHPCIIPASGYYEWSSGHRKYSFADRDTIFMAGLMKKIDGEWRAVILTEDASPKHAEIHGRQPVRIAKEQFDAWLRSGILMPDRPDLNIAEEENA